MKQLYLPRYTIGADAYEYLKPILSDYGKKTALIHGEKAYAACKEPLLEALRDFEIVAEFVYGHEATYENVAKICADPDVKNADFLIGIGGGKCLDTVKVAAERLQKPLFTVATIASTCAAVTKISIMYNLDGTFKEVYKLKEPPVHCFINSQIIAEAPHQYLWAGMGDTMAKHVECVFSAKNDVLDFASSYGRTISSMCFDPVIEKGEKAYEDAKKHVVSEDLEEIIQSILIATGSVSLSVHADYNSALAHALFYGLTCRSHIEKEHLHGEVVSYGTLVQLLMDGQKEQLKRAYAFHKAIGLPVCLKDLGIDREDPMEDILKLTEENPELVHVPYPVTKEMIHASMMALEDYHGE